MQPRPHRHRRATRDPDSSASVPAMPPGPPGLSAKLLTQAVHRRCDLHRCCSTGYCAQNPTARVFIPHPS
eukprot:439750-Prymnesium_polylepis.1